MTEKQRKAIEMHAPMVLSEEKAIEDDDYFFLLSFIIDKPYEISVPTPYPVIQPCPLQPLTPYYGQQWEVTCKVDNNVRQAEM